jgi:PAS domain S-box-containing protein
LQFLRDVMDNIPGPVFSKDINLRFTGCNKEYEKYIALPESEILGKTLPEIQAGELSDFLHRKDEQLIKDGQKQIFEHPLEMADGQRRHLVVHSNVIRNANNELIGIIGLMFDTTDKKEVEERLREESSLNKAMAELSKELLKPGISLSEISRLILDFTKSFTQSENGYAGTIDQENGDLRLHNFNEMIRGGCKVENKNLRLSKKDGLYPGLWGHCLNTMQAFYTNSPNQHPQSKGLPEGHYQIKNFLTVPAIIDGRLTGQIALANSTKPYTDSDLQGVVKLSNLYSIALQKHCNEDELLLAKEKAELSDRLKSAFLSNMSHEIRTPLNAIVGFAQMLGEEGVGEEESREFKSVIINNTDLLLRLINDIIEMSMIEAGELKIHFENRRIKDLLFHIFHTWESRDEVLENHDNIRFELEYPEHDTGAIVKIDALRFAQAIDNLLMNAFRFTRKGKIVLGYRFSEAGDVEVYVNDSGIGISEKDQETIFERFRQVDELKVRQFSGTGLGLAITKKLVEHLSGKIALVSVEDQGSQFTITLPVHEQTPRAKVSAAIEARKRMTDHGEHIKGKNILIVEDNDSSYEFLEILLKRMGARSRRAKDGLEAVEKASADAYDLILMDLQLPKMSGFEAIMQIRKSDKYVPIVVQTAFSEDSEREKAFAAGCNDYLIKPLTKSQIEKTIARYLR